MTFVHPSYGSLTLSPFKNGRDVTMAYFMLSRVEMHALFCICRKMCAPVRPKENKSRSHFRQDSQIELILAVILVTSTYENQFLKLSYTVNVAV